MGVYPFLGEVRLVGFNYAPIGWAKCEGQLLSIAQYSALFQLLGTTYGGDGRTTFGLPDLRGRVPIGAGEGPGLPPVYAGQQSGTTSVHDSDHGQLVETRNPSLGIYWIISLEGEFPPRS